MVVLLPLAPRGRVRTWREAPDKGACGAWSRSLEICCSSVFASPLPPGERLFSAEVRSCPRIAYLAKRVGGRAFSVSWYMREAVALAPDAELRAWRYQPHPHFLFNTLNAISTLITEKRGADANRMLARLADLLRATLERGETNVISLAEKLALTSHYLDIEKIRLGDKLTLELRVGADLLHSAVPVLLLQPLVENAIRHGIAPRSTGGRLELQVERVGERLPVRLSNNGVPSPVDTEATSRPAIGLRNVHERLVRLYGSAHEFAFELAANGDCTVQIAMPLRSVAAVA